MIIFRRIILILIASIACFGSAGAAEIFQADLSPMPLDAAPAGQYAGDAAGQPPQITGTTFTVSGAFGGLTSPATDVHVYLSPDIGVPGAAQTISVTVSPGITGTFSGNVALSARQAAALRAGKLYVVISSQNAPAGNLWGWLLPAHDVVGPNVPPAW